MDCVHQLLHQFPHAFELTVPVLTQITEAYLSGHLTPFLGWSNAKYALASLWDFLHSDYHLLRFVNYEFVPTLSLSPSESKEDIFINYYIIFIYIFD